MLHITSDDSFLVMPQVHKAGNAISPSFITSFNRPPVTSTPASSSPNQSVQATHNKPIGRVAPLNVHPPSSSSSGMYFPPSINIFYMTKYLVQ